MMDTNGVHWLPISRAYVENLANRPAIWGRSATPTEIWHWVSARRQLGQSTSTQKLADWANIDQQYASRILLEVDQAWADFQSK